MCLGHFLEKRGRHLLVHVNAGEGNFRVWRTPLGEGPAAACHLKSWLADLFACGVLCETCRRNALNGAAATLQVYHQPAPIKFLIAGGTIEPGQAVYFKTGAGVVVPLPSVQLSAIVPAVPPQEPPPPPPPANTPTRSLFARFVSWLFDWRICHGDQKKA